MILLPFGVEITLYRSQARQMLSSMGIKPTEEAIKSLIESPEFEEHRFSFLNAYETTKNLLMIDQIMTQGAR